MKAVVRKDNGIMYVIDHDVDDAGMLDRVVDVNAEDYLRWVRVANEYHAMQNQLAELFCDTE